MDPHVIGRNRHFALCDDEFRQFSSVFAETPDLVNLFAIDEQALLVRERQNSLQ